MSQGTDTTSRDQIRRLAQQIWSFCDVLRDDGITYQDYITELSWLLFLRISDSLSGTRSGTRALPAGLRWSDLREAGAENRLDFYTNQLESLAKADDRLTASIFADARTSIRHRHAFSRLVDSIDFINWQSLGHQALGDVYEALLERNATEQRSGAGQYFTPRFLVDMIVRVVDPQLGETVQDPAVGTGGFLVAAARHVRERVSSTEYRTQYVGVELVRSAQRLCLMNLFLHDVGAEVVLGDALAEVGATLPPADIILSNPPFGSKRGAGLVSRPDFSFRTSNKQLAFLQHIYRALTPGGRAAIIIPDSVLFDDGIGRSIRIEMLQYCDVRAILRLPSGIFYAQGVKTNVLFLARKPEAASVSGMWFYDARTDVSPKTSSGNLMSVLAQFEKFYKLNDHERTQAFAEGSHTRARYIGSGEIEDRNYNLDVEPRQAGKMQDETDADSPWKLLEELKDLLRSAIVEADDIGRHLYGDAANGRE